MFEEFGFEPGFEMSIYSRDLPIRLVSDKEIIRNPSHSLAIILNIPNLKL